MDLATIKSAGTDLGTGQRDVNLNDPLVYTTSEIAADPAPLPEGTKLETRGKGLNQRQVLVGEDVGTNPFTHFLKGLADFATFGISDLDQSGNLFGGEHGATGYGREWDQEAQNKLQEIKKAADLSGTPTPTKQEAIDSLPGKRVLDQYETQKMQEQRNEQLKYLLAAYPQLAGMINDEIAKRRYQAETTMPSELQKRFNSARSNYVGALLGRSQAGKNIADAVATGLGRYSGIRNVAG